VLHYDILLEWAWSSCVFLYSEDNFNCFDMELLDTVNAIKNSQVNAFLIWYQAIQTSDLEQFFSLLHR